MFFQILLNKVVKVLGKWYHQVGNIKQCGNIEQSYLFHENSMNSVHNSHVASCLWFRSVTEGLCPTPQISAQPSTFFFCLSNNFQLNKIDALRWSFDQKLISEETSIWFAHVPDCYCSDRKNFTKFEVSFLATKSLFVQMILNNFGCVYLK